MRVRYVETRMMRPSELDPHPLNFRTHPQSQLDALQASIDTVGFARPLEAYLVDGRVRLVDGHGRRELEGDDEVPVVIYDFDEDDARLYMATVDPISALAGQDDERLRALLAEVQAPAGPLADLLDSMAPLTVLGIGEGVVGLNERTGSSPWGRVNASDTVRCLIGDVEFGVPASAIDDWIVRLDESMTTREAAAVWFLRVSQL